MMEISPYFEAEKVPLFSKNLIWACGPLGHLSGPCHQIIIAGKPTFEIWNMQYSIKAELYPYHYSVQSPVKTWYWLL
jgi:hypothetical protein